MYTTLKDLGFYYKKIKTISNIEFTNRQVDVISCIANARIRQKEIANILGIEVTVVRSHITAIREKIKYKSSNGGDIVSFIETSASYNDIITHYNYLLRIAQFDSLLSSLAKDTMRYRKKPVSIYMHRDDESLFLVGNNIKKGIYKHLKTLGFEVSIINLDQKSSTDITDRTKVFVLSTDLAEKIVSDNNLYKNIQRFIMPSSENPNDNAIILSQDIQIGNDLPILFSQSKIVNFDKDYYKSFLELLRKLLPIQSKKFEPLISEFLADSTNCYAKSTRQYLSVNLEKKKLDNLPRINVKNIFIISSIIILLSCFASYIYINQNNIANNQEVWNVPIFSNNIVYRKEIIENIWNKLKHRKYKNTDSTIIGLYGLGGIGKTTIANILVHNLQKQYSFIGWFNSETSELLKNDYIDLGYKYDLLSNNMSDKQKIYAVKEWLEQRENVLLIYDNISNMGKLVNFLPSKGDIIITSKNFNLPEAFEIDVMTEEESTILLGNLLAESKTKHIDKMRDLAKKLGYLPLALSQAGSYISKNKLSISEYLKLYDFHQDRLLSDGTMPALDNHAPAYITWNIALKELETSPEGKEALKLLDFISCCYSSNIPKKLLALYLYGTDDAQSMIRINHLLSTLMHYSLIKLSSTDITVHNLVHSWIKSRLSQEEQLKVLQKARKIVAKAIAMNKDQGWDISFIMSTYPHINELIKQLRLLDCEGDCIDLMCDLADIYFELNKYNASIEMLEEAIAIQKERHGEKKLKTSIILNQLGQAHLAVGNCNKSLELTKAAYQIQKDILSNNIAIAQTLRNLGVIYFALSNYKKSLELLEKALLMEEKLFGKNHIKSSPTFCYLGIVHNALGDFKKSLALSKKALLLQEKHLGMDHLDNAYILRQLGRIYRSLGDFKQSLKLLKRSMDILEKHFETENIEKSYTLCQLGRVYRSMGQHEKSLKTLLDALEIIKKYPGEEHLYSGYVINQLGITHRALGNYTKSLTFLEKALAIKKKFLGETNLKVAYALNHLGITYRMLGDYQMGVSLLQKSLLMKEQILGSDNARLTRSLLELGILYRIMKNYGQSIDLIERALEIEKKHLGDTTNPRISRIRKELRITLAQIKH